MNFKRALWVGLLTYAVPFIIELVVMFASWNLNLPTEISQWIFVANNIIIPIVVAVFFSLLYFKDTKITASAKEGLWFGLVLIVIGNILDIIIFSTTASGSQTIGEYYSHTNYLFWTALVLLLATTTLVGYFKGKK